MYATTERDISSVPETSVCYYVASEAFLDAYMRPDQVDMEEKKPTTKPMILVKFSAPNVDAAATAP